MHRMSNWLRACAACLAASLFVASINAAGPSFPTTFGGNHGIKSTAAAAPQNSLNAQQVTGKGLTDVVRSPWPYVYADIRGGDTTQWKTAIASGTVKGALWMHSIGQGDNQNALGASFYNLTQEYFARAWPNVTFSWKNFSVSGTRASDALTLAPTFAADASTVYKEHWEGVTANGVALWPTYIRTFAPDILFIGFDKNEIDPAAFAVSLQAVITDAKTNAAWTTKATIVLVACDIGTDPAGIVAQTSQVIRDLAAKNGILLLDASRIYQIMTRGVDPAAPSMVTLEWAFREYQVLIAGGPAYTLDTTRWDNRVGVAKSPTGSTLRETTSGNPMKALRIRSTVNGAVQGNYTSSATTSVPALYFREDPTDANYGTNTGKCYYVEISGTTVALKYRASGGGLTTISTGTLTNGITASSTHSLRVNYRGGRFQVKVIAPTGERLNFTAYDFSYLGAGYPGFGFSGAGGGFWNSGLAATIGNKSTGDILEFEEPFPNYGTMFTDGDALGTYPSGNDFLTNTNSYGGNGINHPTGPVMPIVYGPAFYNLLLNLKPGS